MLKRVTRILAISGSIMAFHVGSGFASGQEILQFYTSFGPRQGLAMCLLAFVLFALFSFTILEIGRRYNADPVRLLYLRAGGTLAGGLFYWMTPLLMALVLCVTIAGGGAAMNTLFGISPLTGRILTGLPVLVTALLGLRWITALSGSIGPIIIVCSLALGCFGILQGRDTELWRMLPHTSASWGVSAVSYACFGTITQIPFLLAVGAESDKKSESLWIAMLGNGGYMLTGAVLHLGLYRSLPQVYGEQLPVLRLARQLSDFTGWFYGAILFFSIYTTAVPLVWSVSKAVCRQENSLRYRLSAFALTAFASVGVDLSFDRLLGILYPYIGYISAAFFAVMLVRAYLLPKSSGKDRGQRAANALWTRQTSRRAE